MKNVMFKILGTTYVVMSLWFMWSVQVTAEQAPWLEVLGWIGLVDGTIILSLATVSLLINNEAIMGWAMGDHLKSTKMKLAITTPHLCAAICLMTWIMYHGMNQTMPVL